MATKLALINMKGGVGKSTLAVNIAWEFGGSRNLRVLLVDLDPQANASQYLIGGQRLEGLINSNHCTIWNVFEQLTPTPDMPNPQPLDPWDAIVHAHPFPNRRGCIDLIPSNLHLANTLRSAGNNKEQLLNRTLLEIEDEYDVIVVDCAPTDSMLTTAAYISCDWIVVPVRPEFLSTIGLPLLAQSLSMFGNLHPGQEPEIAGIIFNAQSGYAPEAVKSVREIRQVCNNHGWHVFSSQIMESKSFPKGAREGRPLFTTSYARTVTKRNFQSFANELAGRIGI